jgi:hypothetical protein
MENTNSNSSKHDQWSNEHEILLKSWGDKSNIYYYLHLMTYNLYKIRNMYFALPIIILSTISGSLNIGSDEIFLGLS